MPTEFYSSREDEAPQHLMPKATDLWLLLVAVLLILFIATRDEDTPGQRPITTTQTTQTQEGTNQ